MKAFSVKKQENICRNCDDYLVTNIQRLKSFVQNQDARCFKCKMTSKIFYIKLLSDDFDKFCCNECCDFNELKTLLDKSGDQKFRNILLNIKFAKSASELESNYQECLKVFKNDKFNDAFVYVIKDETNFPDNIDQYSYEDYKKDFIYVGKSQLHVLCWQSSSFRHFNLDSSSYVKGPKRSVIKNILNNNGKCALFRPFIQSSINNMFFHESMMISHSKDENLANDFPNHSNQQHGKTVIVFKDERISSQLEEYVFRKSYQQYKQLKLDEKVRIIDSNYINEIPSFFSDYDKSF